MLKVSRELEELRMEAAALRLWDGHGSCRLLAESLSEGAILLERLNPGTTLAETAADDDDLATHVAAGLLRVLWRPLPLGGTELSPLDSWCAAFDRNRAAILRGGTPFPVELFRRGDELRADPLASMVDPVVLHGDLHHYNILRAERAEWLAIDPKGLAGDRHFDVCQFMSNPRRRPMDRRVLSRRLDLLCDALGLQPKGARAWCVVHAVLNACWALEDGAPIAEELAWAELMLLV